MATAASSVPSAKEDGKKTYTFICKGLKFSLDEVQLKKVPYLEGLLVTGTQFGQSPSSGDGNTIEINDPKLELELLKVALQFVKTGRAKYLALAPIGTNGIKPSSIFEFMDFLLISKPSIPFEQLKTQLKNITTERDEDGLNRFNRSADRSRARDVAIEICWLIYEKMKNDSSTFHSNSEQQKVYNTVVFILGHPRTFYPNQLREFVYEFYNEYFIPTPKQKNIIERWMEKFHEYEPRYLDFTENDASSSDGSAEEVFDFYYSDSSD